MQPSSFLSDAGLNQAEEEAIEIAQRLIQIDTTNTGKSDTTKGERAAAEYVAELLAEVGIDSESIDADPDHPERGRVSVVARWRGSDPGQPGLVVHGHLDVVPPGEGWTHDPFGGKVADDRGDDGPEPYLHGRGAIDMKGQVAIALATIRQAVREGKKPPRDVVLSLFSDEEAGGTLGAQYVVKNRPDLFEGCSEVLGLEVGGFSFSLPNGKRVYLVQTGERGMGWGEFTTKGTQGHGSQVNHDNPLVKMVSALHRLTNEDSSLQAPLTDTMRQTLGTLAGGLGMEFDESDPMAVIRELGPIAKWLENSVQSGFNLTQVHGGEKDNVVPGSTKSTVDVRPLPGQEEEFKATVERLLGDDVEKNWKVFLNGWENPLPTDAERAMSEAIGDQDPEALVVGWVM
ncbi:MAG: M20/M25/M40 family metallo-hydrolase, partial [Terriglobales bacterium]